MSQELTPSPAIADMDGDGVLDIIACSTQGKLNVWSFAGEMHDGWPVQLEANTWSSPVIGDIDGDGMLEIAIGSMSGELFVYNNDGTLTDGWPVGTGSSIIGSASLADLAADPPARATNLGDGRYRDSIAQDEAAFRGRFRFISEDSAEQTVLLSIAIPKVSWRLQGYSEEQYVTWRDTIEELHTYIEVKACRAPITSSKADCAIPPVTC